jgi:ferrous iron transport protein B
MTARRILLAGNPNAGKSTLFNALSGLRAKTANYAGVTVEQRAAMIRVGDHDVELVDTPGMYSMVPRADDEDVAVTAILSSLHKDAAAVVVVVVDACQLERNLQLVAQLREWPLRLMLAVTMLDVVERDGDTMHLEALSRHIGIPVFDSRTLASKLNDVLQVPVATPINPPRTPMVVDDGATDAWMKSWQLPSTAQAAARSWLGQAELVVRDDQRGTLRLPNRSSASTSNQEAAAQLVHARYQRAQQWMQGVRSVVTPHVGEPRSARITRAVDAMLLHPIFGIVVMMVLFAGILQALFSWSAPLMDGIESMVGCRPPCPC